MLKAPRFGSWMGATSTSKKNDSDERRRARIDLCHQMRKDENALAELISRMITHMGANIRACHFLCFQTQLGYRKNEPITLAEVKEVIPSVIDQGWVNPASRDTYEKHLASDGNMHSLADDFKGKGRLKALWDVTGYALQGGMWTNSPTREMYLQQLAAFSSMMAPKELPTLPGIGGDGEFYQLFSISGTRNISRPCK